MLAESARKLAIGLSKGSRNLQFFEFLGRQPLPWSYRGIYLSFIHVHLGIIQGLLTGIYLSLIRVGHALLGVFKSGIHLNLLSCVFL